MFLVLGLFVKKIFLELMNNNLAGSTLVQASLNQGWNSTAAGLSDMSLFTPMVVVCLSETQARYCSPALKPLRGLPVP